MEEVRLAMAWNGGVSLAIWMGGVAAELDAARRAGGEVRSNSQPLYAAICEAFNRRIVVDIITGASAGGLNGGLLAGAIEKETPLEPDFLRSRWLEIGDFDLLLQPLGKEKAPSLMQGELFYEKLKGAFADLLGGDGDGDEGLAAAKVLLDVQVTDVAGKEHAFCDDFSEIFYAREYRAPVRFRKRRDYSPGTLAAAARASASFPGAFEAQKLTGTAARLAGFPDETRWAIDGGLLENAPIRPAIDLIPTRRASGPVKRFVCYVNAHPHLHEEDLEDPAQPQLAKVLSYNIKLPLVARTIDQLTALEKAKRHGGLTHSVGVGLLGVEPTALKQAARGLLPGYQYRRAVLSLVELLEAPGVRSGPGLARRVLELLGDPLLLPWIPADLTPTKEADRWQWGVRAAQRVLELELDVLRLVLDTVTAEQDASAIFQARKAVDDAIAQLDTLHDEFIDPTGAITAGAQGLYGDPSTRAHALGSLAEMSAGTGVTILGYLKAATRAFHRALRELSLEARAAAPSGGQLFGPAAKSEFDSEQFFYFLELALAIEVIRRSFSDDTDIESAQELHVAQLTPMARTPLFSHDPLKDPGPCSPEEKLTGIRLNHFAAFYRSSWRANDFMWGRLDGASNLVRMLVDPTRARAVAHHSAIQPWSRLAAALVPEGSGRDASDQRRLIAEVLQISEPPPASAPGAVARLRTRLQAELQRDLTVGKGELTEVVCTRALQYTIFSEEAPHLVEQCEKDSKRGAHATELGWNLEGSLMPLVERLRGWRADKSLPSKLGRDDPDESTSPLAFRTISRSGIVGLSALGGAVPLARLLQPVRVPLFALQGMTAKLLLDRVAVVVGFAGAAWYLAARWLTMPAKPSRNVALGELWSPEVLALWVCMFAVLGVLLVPAVRAIRTDCGSRRVEQGLLALATAVGGGALALGWQLSTQGTANALTAAHARYAPPDALLWIVAAAGGFQVASNFQKLTSAARLVPRIAPKLISTAGVTAIAIGGPLAVLAMWNALWPALNDGGWQTAIAIVAIAAPIVVAWDLLRPRRRAASAA